jgi:hypothetical protein
MISELTISKPAWVKTLPCSRMIYPENFADKLKYMVWRFYTPFHPFIRDMLISIGLAKHEGRQNYLIGFIAPNQTFEGIVSYLVEKGYGNHFIAWKDQGELVGLRYVEDFARQYHIRIFEDGEIRGHYEYTPECYPILHMKAVDQKDCREKFLNLLGNRIIAN